MSERLDREPAAVLFSGGLDSAVLLADLAERGAVLPIYVRAGLAWEDEEAACLDQLLAGRALCGARREAREYRRERPRRVPGVTLGGARLAAGL